MGIHDDDKELADAIREKDYQSVVSLVREAYKERPAYLRFAYAVYQFVPHDRPFHMVPLAYYSDNDAIQLAALLKSKHEVLHWAICGVFEGEDAPSILTSRDERLSLEGEQS